MSQQLTRRDLLRTIAAAAAAPAVAAPSAALAGAPQTEGGNPMTRMLAKIKADEDLEQVARTSGFEVRGPSWSARAGSRLGVR